MKISKMLLASALSLAAAGAFAQAPQPGPASAPPGVKVAPPPGAPGAAGPMRFGGDERLSSPETAALEKQIQSNFEKLRTLQREAETPAMRTLKEKLSKDFRALEELRRDIAKKKGIEYNAPGQPPGGPGAPGALGAGPGPKPADAPRK